VAVGNRTNVLLLSIGIASDRNSTISAQYREAEAVPEASPVPRRRAARREQLGSGQLWFTDTQGIRLARCAECLRKMHSAICPLFKPPPVFLDTYSRRV
jgi:hypothetical protein